MNKQEVISFCNKKIPLIERFVQSRGLSSNFQIGKVQLDFSPKQRSSRGGLYTIKSIKVPGINMAFYHYLNKNKDNVYKFNEYPSYAKHPIIGSFLYTNQQLSILAELTHEIAHAVQFWNWDRLISKRPAPHGDEFKKAYSQLRVEFVNKYLEDQISLSKIYDSYKINAINKERI